MITVVLTATVALVAFVVTVNESICPRLRSVLAAIIKKLGNQFAAARIITKTSVTDRVVARSVTFYSVHRRVGRVWDTPWGQLRT